VIEEISLMRGPPVADGLDAVEHLGRVHQVTGDDRLQLRA
jgi:hypothetical protein